jgi:hypothetical protein
MLTLALGFLAGVLSGMILYGALVVAAESEHNDAAN